MAHSAAPNPSGAEGVSRPTGPQDAEAAPSPRRLNERRIVARLAAARPRALSRAQLAEDTGLSAPTVGKVADALIAAGLLEETANDHTGFTQESGAPPTLGRPARPLQLARTTPRLLALQLGVRHTRLAALPVAGPADDTWPVRFATPRRAETWQRRLRDAAQQIPLKHPWAVIVSVPGVVDEQARRVLLSPNLHWTQRAELASLVRSVFDAPALLVQEIRALALGHLAALGSDAPRDFLLTDFGDGVGAAVVRDGELYEGALPLSGELGHTPVGGNHRACGCGAIGCMETLVSRPGLLRSFADAHRIEKTPRWPALVKHVAQHGVEPWLADALDAAARVMAGAMNVLGLRHLVITGALAELPDSVRSHLAQSVQRSAMWARFGTLTVTTAPRRRAAGLVAAGIDRVLLPRTGASVLPAEQPLRRKSA